jgi:hypothetical protein
VAKAGEVKWLLCVWALIRDGVPASGPIGTLEWG